MEEKSERSAWYWMQGTGSSLLVRPSAAFVSRIPFHFGIMHYLMPGTLVHVLEPEIYIYIYISHGI